MIYELSFKIVDGFYMPEDESIERVLEAEGSCKLWDLLFCLLDSLDFDFDHMYEFHIGKKSYSGSPAGSEGKDASLDSLKLKKGSKFRLIYDFGDDWTFDIVVKEIHEGSTERGIRVISSTGEVEQYPDYEDWEGEYDGDGTSFLTPEQKLLADEIGEYQLLLFNDDESAAADRILEIWPKIKEYVGKMADSESDTARDDENGEEPIKPTIDEVDPSYELEIWNALMDSDLPFLNLKRYEEGIQLWSDILKTFRWEGNDGDQLRGAIGEALAELGEKERMFEYFRLWEEKNQKSITRMNSHLLALEEIKDWETAKERLEEYLTLVDDDMMKELIYQRAVEIYKALGDGEKLDYYSRELEKIEEEINEGIEDWMMDDELFFDSQLQNTVVRSEPKIYPNDPCPCGSGKKYKKCCGKNR